MGESMPRRGRKGPLLRTLLRYVAATPLLLALAGWAGLAIWFDGPQDRTVAWILGALPVVGTLGAILLLRPLRRAALTSLALFLVVLLWWLSIEPSNDRDWLPDVARPATADFDGSRVVVHNVRDFDYRSESDFTERWETRTFDLDRLTGMDFFISYWDSPLIAHTIVSWEFSDGRHLAISIETRKEKGESYSAVRGFFRQFELYYVVADERDVIRLRTNYRNEEVYLYRLKVPVTRARALLVDYLKKINRLAVHPEWYNAFTQNCTTSIRRHAMNVAPRNPFNWRVLVNGRIDELGYMRGTVDTTLPFDELRRRSNISERGRAADGDPEFSQRIREGLPGQGAASAGRHGS